ncbi:hypothetical protein BpHYR1_031722 [Brachionus plicatilis]|uniref:Uncharacterized protein n=1 Tax=Brachionus plicatilis TaxID=10195 RepID=A0A3M7PL83_BRAPC|nr:hypothetical protein BpHYR1_031722 [Brachionus plicatilis]
MEKNSNLSFFLFFKLNSNSIFNIFNHKIFPLYVSFTIMILSDYEDGFCEVQYKRTEQSCQSLSSEGPKHFREL